jgi:hypothetical protein
VHDHGERVGGDLELGVLDALLLAGRDLLLLDRARGVGDVGLARAERLEPAAVPAWPMVAWMSGFSSEISSLTALLRG